MVNIFRSIVHTDKQSVCTIRQKKIGFVSFDLQIAIPFIYFFVYSLLIRKYLGLQ